MPDGAPATTARHGQDADSRLVRRVRWQLIAWSAGSTLVVLLALGATLYTAVATTLASASESLLRERAALLAGEAFTASASPIAGTGQIGHGTSGVSGIVGTSGVVSVVGTDASLPGFAVGGPFSGTLALVVPADATAALGSGTGEAVDPDGYAEAFAGGTAVRETTYAGAPVRVLSMPLPTAPPGGPAGVLQVVGDRTAELRTLGVLAAVLVVGGLAALAFAALLGSLYATRALVPIRASLRRQREFAADTSHELRTPLAVIRAGVARVRQQPDARVADVTPVLEAVDEEAVRLGALVDDLLALARTDAGTADLDLRDVDLAEVAAASVAALEPLAARRGVRLALHVEPAPARGDEDRLRRLVTVLVDNAIRHGREGGNVLVTVRTGSLQVEDDGPGIPAASRRRVFERFWRGAGAAPGGSGLGLAIAGWIVERHGGHIEVDEGTLGGARFSVTMPVTPRFTNSS